MAREAVRLVIRGRVQGVGYRWWATGQARRLGLDGWVRNLTTGEVELLAMGEPGALAHLQAACARGPSSAMVSEVQRFAAEDDGTTGFRERATL
jgi:acylphosphatase